jgi:hypothetical protein
VVEKESDNKSQMFSLSDLAYIDVNNWGSENRRKDRLERLYGHIIGCTELREYPSENI